MINILCILVFMYFMVGVVFTFVHMNEVLNGTALDYWRIKFDDKDYEELEKWVNELRNDKLMILHQMLEWIWLLPIIRFSEMLEKRPLK